VLQHCVILNQYVIWEPGDGLPGSEADTFTSIQSTVRVEVNGVLQTELELFPVQIGIF
jgi:hypothetical protein